MAARARPRRYSTSDTEQYTTWLKETEQESQERLARLEASGVTKLQVGPSLECVSKDLRHAIGRVFTERYIAGRRPDEQSNFADQNSRSILSACMAAYAHSNLVGGQILVETLGDRRRDVEREIYMRPAGGYPKALTGFNWSNPPDPKPFEYRCAEYVFFGPTCSK